VNIFVSPKHFSVWGEQLVLSYGGFFLALIGVTFVEDLRLTQAFGMTLVLGSHLLLI
jgi:hypothetical protein